MKKGFLFFLAILFTSPIFGEISEKTFEFSYEGQTLSYRVISEDDKTVEVGDNEFAEGSVFIPETVTNNGVAYRVVRIGEGAFSDCQGLISIVVPETITEIGDGAFSYCYGLIEVKLPNSLKRINNTTFYECMALTSITIPESIEEIGEEALWGCESLSSLVIPETVTEIGEGAFSCCYGLTEINLPNTLKRINDATFYECTGLTSISIPESVEEIGEYVFYGCESLEKAEFASLASLMNINFANAESNPLYEANHLIIDGEEVRELKIPNTVTTIKKCTFTGCSSLTSIEIPESVTEIGEYAFANCEGLTSIDIPDSVVEIGESAFSFCINLTQVRLSNCLTEISNYLFFGCSNLISVVIPNSVTKIGEDAFGFCVSLVDIVIPNSVIEIGNLAFYYCTNLKDLRFPNSIIKIGDGAFSKCTSLTSIDLPNSVSEIGMSVFSECEKLSSINLPNTLSEIKEYSFLGCALTEVVLPPSVTKIGTWAFFRNDIKRLEMGYSIEEIEDEAFRDNSIENIYITAQNPPILQNNPFNYYNSQLWVTNSQAVGNYQEQSSNWSNFNHISEMVVIDKLSLVNENKVWSQGETFKPDVRIEPENATLKTLFWNSTRPDLISVDNDGNITFLASQASLTRADETCQVLVSTMYEETQPLILTFKVNVAGVEQVLDDRKEGTISNDVFNMQGICIKKNASQEEVNSLKPGLYIYKGRKFIVN